MIQNAADLVTDEFGVTEEFARRHASQQISEIGSRLRSEQKLWPDVTDFDRLEQAFAKLEESGVVCRHNFSCCGTCAAGEIWGEIKQEQQGGRTIRGAAHYHCQDTEGAIEGSYLHFSYASVAEGDDALKAIGHEIVAALSSAGLETHWNGETGQRMSIKIDWKRRI